MWTTFIDGKEVDVGCSKPKWDVRRNGYWGYSDEWVSCNHWTGSRVVLESASRNMRVLQNISIRGSRRSNGKLRPRRWASSVSVGGITEQVSTIVERGSSCNSVTDATCRAGDHPELKAAIARLLGRLYRRAGAQCVYRWSEEEGAWKPCCTSFYTGFDLGNTLAKGKYCEVRWQVPMQSFTSLKRGEEPETEPKVVRSIIDVHAYGYSGVCGSKEDTIKSLVPWLDNLDRTC